MNGLKELDQLGKSIDGIELLNEDMTSHLHRQKWSRVNYTLLKWNDINWMKQMNTLNEWN